jgi:general secretion pathway protein J
MSRRKTLSPRGRAGFTLVEALASLALMGAIVASLSAVTGQWLPSWRHGFNRVQRIESVDLGLQRLVDDLDAAEFVTPNGTSKTPLFLGDAKSVTIVRAANAPGASPHLEFVKLAETVDQRGFALVRSHAPFKPLDPNRPIETQLYFTDPVVLVRAPFRVSFAFAGADRQWRDSWRGEVLLPSAARIEVRDAATEQILAVSTVALLHVDLPAECVAQKSPRQCIDGMSAKTNAQSPETNGPPKMSQPNEPANGPTNGQ